MKTSVLILISLITLASCQKEAAVAPATTAPVKISVAAAAVTDTIPDHAAFKIKLIKDSDNSDETLFVFNKKANPGYDGDEDADYFPGYGPEGLASLSTDGKELAMNMLPYTPGMSIDLDVRAKNDGKLTLKISYESKIPEHIQIWVKDMYLKDSVNVRTTSYSFNVIKADANSFGTKRFKLIIKDSAQSLGSLH